MKEVILIGPKLLENNTYQHSVLSIKTLDSHNPKIRGTLSYFPFNFSLPSPLCLCSWQYSVD